MIKLHKQLFSVYTALDHLKIKNYFFHKRRLQTIIKSFCFLLCSVLEDSTSRFDINGNNTVTTALI